MQLGLTDEQFYRLTPRQFHLLVDQHRERTRHQEWMTGIIASTVANFSMQAPKQPLKATDFMPSAPRSKEPPLKRRAIARKIRDFLNAKIECQTSSQSPASTR